MKALALVQPAFAGTRVEEALQAEASGDYTKALPIWEELGNSGDRAAMVSAGLIYHQGLGRATDYDKALDWYLRSMNDDAINNMGVMYRDGTGVPKNRKIAIYYS